MSPLPDACAATCAPHEFRADPLAWPWIHICWCGKWPLHHIHTGNRPACTCDECTGRRP